MDSGLDNNKLVCGYNWFQIETVITVLCNDFIEKKVIADWKEIFNDERSGKVRIKWCGGCNVLV